MKEDYPSVDKGILTIYGIVIAAIVGTIYFFKPSPPPALVIIVVGCHIGICVFFLQKFYKSNTSFLGRFLMTLVVISIPIIGALISHLVSKNKKLEPVV
jgi:hypothetical protein